MPILKKIVMTSVLSSLVWSTATAKDFAMGDWFDSKQTVLAKEKRSNHSLTNSKQLVFKGKIAEFDDSLIVYQFEDNRLTNGFFDFNQQHIIFQDHIRDFFIIVDLLEEKYGQAKNKQQFWQQQSQITEKEQWGNAIAAGLLSLQSQWETDQSHITLQLTLNKDQIQQRLIYQASADGLDDKSSGF